MLRGKTALDQSRPNDRLRPCVLARLATFSRMAWQLQEAKNRLSELVDRALSEGPQTITRHGNPTVIVVAVEQYAQQTQSEKLSAVLRACPVKGWTIRRDRDAGRTLRFE